MYVTLKNKSMIEIDILDQDTMHSTTRKKKLSIMLDHFILEGEITNLSLKMNVRFIFKIFYLI